jgi:hypothetical protein
MSHNGADMANQRRRRADAVPLTTSYANDSKARPTHANTETIRERAFEIYAARGSAAGHELDDWLQAERELRAD